MTARPMFTAQAQLMIDARKVQIFQQQSVFGDIPIDTAQVESQVEVLKSENIASAVIKNLHLTEDPEFVRPGGGLLNALFDFVFSQFGSDQRAPSEFELFRRAIGAFESRLSVKRIGLDLCDSNRFPILQPRTRGRRSQMPLRMPTSSINCRQSTRQHGEPALGCKTG